MTHVNHCVSMHVSNKSTGVSFFWSVDVIVANMFIAYIRYKSQLLVRIRTIWFKKGPIQTEQKQIQFHQNLNEICNCNRTNSIYLG